MGMSTWPSDSACPTQLTGVAQPRETATAAQRLQSFLGLCKDAAPCSSPCMPVQDEPPSHYASAHTSPRVPAQAKIIIAASGSPRSRSPKKPPAAASPRKLYLTESSHLGSSACALTVGSGAYGLACMSHFIEGWSALMIGKQALDRVPALGTVGAIARAYQPVSNAMACFAPTAVSSRCLFQASPACALTGRLPQPAPRIQTTPI